MPTVVLNRDLGSLTIDKYDEQIKDLSKKLDDMMQKQERIQKAQKWKSASRGRRRR